MHGIKEIIQEAESLPVEERAIVVDSLLRTFNPADTKIESEWVGGGCKTSPRGITNR